jgi:MoxR-like ATPase
MRKVRVGNVELQLAEPVERAATWIGRGELIDQLLACWTLVTDDDLPLCPRIVGQPGMGKTTLAQAAGARIGLPVFIYQCTMDTRPEDLLVTPVLTEGQRISYHASPLVTAMLDGGVVILDEANRMSEKSWASLAPLLDDRRYVESVIAGTRIQASPEFRCCVTMNNDASTYEVPDYITSRLQPLIEVGFPDADDELSILSYNVAFAPGDLLRMTVDLLQAAHGYRLGYSTRDGVNIMRYALKLEKAALEPDLPTAFHRAVEQILGAGAEDVEARARGHFMLGNMQDLSGFFTTEEDLDDDDDDDDD